MNEDQVIRNGVAEIIDMKKKIDQIHECICGSITQPRGLLVRMDDLESWRKSVGTRLKAGWVWVYSILGAVFIKFLDRFIK